MENTSGFYKSQEQEEVLLFAPNFVDAPTYSLSRKKKDTYTYPVEGWHWFETEDEAYAFFYLEKPIASA